MSLDTCREQDGILLQFFFTALRNRLGFIIEDDLDIVTRSASVNCRALRDLAAAGETGVVSHVFPDRDDEIEDDSDEEGSFNWTGRVRLLRR